MKTRSSIYANITASTSEEKIAALLFSLRDLDIYALSESMGQLIKSTAEQFSSETNPMAYLDLEAHRQALVLRYEQSMTCAQNVCDTLRDVLIENPYNIKDALQCASIYLDPTTPSYHAHAASVAKDCITNDISPCIRPTHSRKDMEKVYHKGFTDGYEKSQSNKTKCRVFPLIELDLDH